MIYITRLNHAPSVLNSDLIEQIEITPDTVITLTNGQKYMVLEEPEELIERVVQFRQRCWSGIPEVKARQKGNPEDSEPWQQ